MQIGPDDRALGQTGSVIGDIPLARPYGVSDEDAIVLCREWMVYLGATDAIAASNETRKLCDLYSSHYLAWVDNRRGNLDIDAVDRAARLSLADGRRALIFVHGGVRPLAQRHADSLGVALLWYDARNGSLEGGNRVGLAIRASGLVNE
jgi:hypothetical protein